MRDAIRNLAAAVLWGTSAGGAPFLLITIPVFWSGLEHSGVEMIWAAFLPLVYAGLLVLAAAIAIGLPLTALLGEAGMESPVNYMIAGALFGFLIPATLLAALVGEGAVGLLFGIPGTLAGTATAFRWSMWRTKVQSQDCGLESE
ncbi:hypothetical protein [Alteraurantiacibacter aquimixticola]|uniref:Uncharacterized protein n=1 Tax=Alteraurantiacibacter aquimixticola TaxID=2489173 RepID=A0A4T3F0K0_9SPHN|nr:hypothetical protein [Alteraurantiacibacter aquimixticola]TIX49437.1 hypothetical protein E5222_11305 [Alteraurantiacibacter aquimixticola]